jgi:hypothetical protein
MGLFEQAKDPATMQTAAGYPELKSMQTAFLFSSRERETLRKLAAKVAEIAARPETNNKKKLWTLHNDLKTTEPLVFIDPENGLNEIIDSKNMI